VSAGRLWRLSPDLVPDTDVFAACREEDADASFTTDVIARVEQGIASAPRRQRVKNRAIR
jgi:hypothetical protein